MTTATDHQITLSNFRVEYIAPDYSKGHVFQPYCAILADAAELDGKEVRVFDVPDPDEDQRAVAQFACDAINQRTELVRALRDCVQSLKRLPDVDGAYRVTCIAQAENILNMAKGDQTMTQLGVGFYKGAGIPKGPRVNVFAECGCCGAFHRTDFNGDCREDSERHWDLPDDAEVIYLDDDGDVTVCSECGHQSNPGDETHYPECSRIEVK